VKYCRVCRHCCRRRRWCAQEIRTKGTACHSAVPKAVESRGYGAEGNAGDVHGGGIGEEVEGWCSGHVVTYAYAEALGDEGCGVVVVVGLGGVLGLTGDGEVEDP
jgi:hypothetical protein